MQGDYVEELVAFGFTANQAKIYSVIIQSKLITVGKIAEFTHLHRQDIYKILPKLERLGLIVKTIDKPIKIQAIPVEKALNNLIIKEREEADERINRLEANVKDIVNMVRAQQEKARELIEEPVKFLLLSTDAEIKNMSQYCFENARIGCDMVISLELLTKKENRFYGYFQTLADNNVRTRLIIETLEKDLTERIIKKMRPQKGNFTAKIIVKEKSTPYYVIDGKEVWISRKQLNDVGLPTVFLTNSSNMVQFRVENFEEAWNSPQAILIEKL